MEYVLLIQLGQCRDYADRMTSRLYRVDEEARVHLVKELPNMVIWAMETGRDFLVLWASYITIFN